MSHGMYHSERRRLGAWRVAATFACAAQSAHSWLAAWLGLVSVDPSSNVLPLFHRVRSSPAPGDASLHRVTGRNLPRPGDPCP